MSTVANSARDDGGVETEPSSLPPLHSPRTTPLPSMQMRTGPSRSPDESTSCVEEKERKAEDLRQDLMKLMMGDELRIKFQYMDEKSALNLQRPVDFKSLESYLQSKYQRRLNIYYTTLSRDLVIQIRNQDELDHVIQLHDKANPGTRMRLVLSQKRNSTEHSFRPPALGIHQGIAETPLSETSSMLSSLSTPNRFRCCSRGDDERMNEDDSLPLHSPRPPMNWREGRCLGRGAFGQVYVCLNIDNGEQLVVKKIRIGSTSKLRSRIFASLENEINLLGTLHHPHIVQYFGVQESRDCVNIFMELMAGGSLRDQINDYGALSSPTTILFTTQILNGLSYLHSKGVVHRDIKPGNILRHAKAHVKIGDFGSAKYLQTLCTEEGVDLVGLIGTPHYLPPEVIKGSRKFDQRSDIWSLGITVFEMLMARTPWWNVDANAVHLRIANAAQVELHLPTSIDDNLACAMKKMLEISVELRPTAKELLTAKPFNTSLN